MISCLSVTEFEVFVNSIILGSVGPAEVINHSASVSEVVCKNSWSTKRYILSGFLVW
jgi:hypothetical protein